MFSRRILVPVTILCIAVSARNAAAIGVQLSLSYDGSLAADGVTPINSVLDPNTGLPDRNEPGSTHQYNVFMTLHDLGSNENLQSLQFDVVLAPGVTPSALGGWIANNPQYDPGGPSGMQPLFSVNADGGANDKDLHTMIVLVDGAAAAAALEPGESGPFYIGRTRVQWDNTLSDLGGLLGMQAHGDSPWGIYRDGIPVGLGRTTFTIDAPVSWSDQPPVIDPPVIPASGTLTGGVGMGTSTPEPGTATIAGIALAGYVLLIRSRRLRA
jgi:hypothetical protein